MTVAIDKTDNSLTAKLTATTRPLVVLAPMAGFSDAPMRMMAARFGIDAVVSEMVASQEWKTGRLGVNAKLERGDLPARTSFLVQIAGRDSEMMAETAQFAADQGADQIDINMGCPAKKVTSGQTAGAALLREPDLALRIIESVASAVSIPVSVKTRLGWDQHDTKGLAPRMVSAGASMLTIHGRTRAQKYQGQADWRAIGEIVQEAGVPILANGDIDSAKRAQTAIAHSGAQGVMIGRAMTGAPWLGAQVMAGFGAEQPDCEPFGSQSELIATHYEAILAHYGAKFGLLNARKHLNAYYRDAPPEFRARILRETDHSQVLRLIKTDEWALAC